MTWKVIERAVRVAMLELHFQGEELAKTVAVGMGLLDLIDYCLFCGMIAHESERLPMDLDFYLSGVYAYLGDPL